MDPGLDHIGVSVVFACHDGTGIFLMAKRGAGARDEQGRWEFGAGRLEHGENWDQAVTREVLEEYGATSKKIEFLTAGNSLRKVKDHDAHWVWLLFAVNVDPTEVRNNEPHKLDEVAWFTLDALPSPLHPSVPGHSLEALANYLKQQAVTV